MRTSLDKAIEASLKGYIYKQQDIDETASKLFNTPVRELGVLSVPFYKFCTDSILSFNDIDSEHIESITYGELLALADNSCGIIPYDNEENEQLKQHNRAMFIAYAVEMLSKSEKSTAAAKLFLKCSVMSYFEYAYKKSGRSETEAASAFIDYSDDILSVTDLRPNSVTTIGDLLCRTNSIETRKWNPWTSFSSFEIKIRKSYAIKDRLFTEVTALAFPEIFNIKAIQKKYSCEHTKDIPLRKEISEAQKTA